MKCSVCPQLIFLTLFVLQSQLSLGNVGQAREYSEERIYYVESSVGNHHQVFPKIAAEQKQPIYHQHQYSQDQNHPNRQLSQQQHPHHQHQPISQPYDDLQFSHSQQPNEPQQQHPHHNPQHQPQLPEHDKDQQLNSHHGPPQAQQASHQQIPLQQLNQQRFDEQHQSLANNMQQVLLHTTGGQYYWGYSQSEWRHEFTHGGDVQEIIMNNFEVASHPMVTREELTFYQYQYQYQLKSHHHEEQHSIISRPLTDENIDYEIHKAYRPTQPSCTSKSPSILMQTNSKEQTCQASYESRSTDPSGGVPNFSHKPSHNSNIEFPLATHHYHYESSLISAIRHYWREVSGLCLASAIFLNWLFVVIKRRFVPASPTRVEHTIESTKQTPNMRYISKDTNSSSLNDSAFEETPPLVHLEDIDTSRSSSDRPIEKSNITVQPVNCSMRQRSSTLRAEPIPIPSSATSGHNSQPTSLSNSLNTSEYSSRYSSDFDSIQRLGRGGFGIVFEAKNKIDDCHYAVKRICLPLEKEARERVMREVRALAKLDHAGIVRYYNAWLETPPDEWLKQHDAQLGIVHSRDGMSFPSTDGIYERNGSEFNTKGASISKLGESGDNSSGLFGNGSFKRRSNGFRRLLKNNSSSPSLDIVFEGSGSIRLESENNTDNTDSSEDGTSHRGTTNKGEKLLHDGKYGDNISDSEDSDFIQFESRASNNLNSNGMKIGDEFSTSSRLTEPFSSSESEDVEDNYPFKNKTIETKRKQVYSDKKNALNYQRELRQLNNASLTENLHVEKVYLYIQMQLCRKDTLKDWLKTNCEIRDKTTIFDLFYQIVDAVEYVHSQDLIHRDLKPSNIFFSLDGTLKIGDFGLCRAKTSAGIGSSLDLQEYVAESDVERGFEAVHTEQVGTQLYMSPEQLNGLSYNQKVDVFAMGLILLELLVPFKTQMQRVNVLFKARNNLYSDEFRSDHPKEHELVKSLLSRSPQKRPTATEIKQHELLASAQLSQPVIERIYHRRRTISSNSSTE